MRETATCERSLTLRQTAKDLLGPRQSTCQAAGKGKGDLIYATRRQEYIYIFTHISGDDSSH